MNAETGASSLHGRNSAGGVAFVVDLASGDTAVMEDVSLASIGLKEREDLQRWISEHPEVVGEGLLLVTSEFDRWESKVQKVYDRLDLLFVDAQGCPLVAELKRDKATDTVELQALKYAAYCSQLTFDDLSEEYARYHGVTVEDARGRLLDHAPRLEEHGPGRIRVRLIAGEFGTAVTSVVLMLRDYDFDIGCIEVKAKRADSGHVIVNSRQIIPLPQAEDYLVRRRRKEQEDEVVRQQTVDVTWEMYANAYTPDRIALARELYRRIESYIADRELDWQPALRSYYFGFKRAGGYYVPSVVFHTEKPIQFNIKVPDDPARLKLEDPYPALESYWDGANRQWCWYVPSLEQVPDLTKALDISAGFQPESGPMPPPGDAEASASAAAPAAR